MTAAEVVAVAVVVAAAIPANLFPVLYWRWAKWWRTPEGRHLFFFVLGMAALIDLSLVRRAIGDFEGRDEIALAVYLVICYQLYRRLWLLIKYNSRRARAERKPDHPYRRATDRS